MPGRTFIFMALTILMAIPRGASAEGEAPPLRESSPPKSSGLALGLSVGLPVAGYGMMALTGLVPGDVTTFRKVAMVTGATLALAGPSGGNLYIGRSGRALAFTGGRLLLATAALIAFTEGIKFSDSSESDYRPDTARTYMVGLLLCGAGVLGLSAWESVDTYRTAHAAELARRSETSLFIAPLVVPDGHRLALGGLSLGGTY